MSYYSMKYKLQRNFFPFLFGSMWMTGVALSTVISWAKYKSLLLALGHGTIGWLYIAYDFAVSKGLINF